MLPFCYTKLNTFYLFLWLWYVIILQFHSYMAESSAISIKANNKNINKKIILNFSSNNSNKKGIIHTNNHNNSVKLENNLNLNKNNDSTLNLQSSILSSSKNKTNSNFFDESKLLPSQSNISYSYKSEVIKIKPVKRIIIGRSIDNRIEDIINQNIPVIKSHLSNLDNILKKFEDDTKNIKTIIQ